MKPETLRGILIVAAIVIVLFIVTQLREKKNKNLAATGEDKSRVRSVADRLFANVPDCRSLYGHYEDVQHYGRSTRTTYYRYLFAHDSQRLWIAPLEFQQGSILPGQPIQITKDDLGKADVTVRNAKDGSTTRVDFILFDKTGKQIIQACATAENLRENSYYPVNIMQEEEVARFGQFMTQLANQVNQENAALNEEMARETNKTAGRTSMILAIIGIVIGLLLPFCGIILGIIGMVLSPKKEDNFGKTPASRIMSIVCICASIAFAVIQVVVML